MMNCVDKLQLHRCRPRTRSTTDSIWVCLVVSLTIATLPVQAQTPLPEHPKGYVAHPAREPIVVDGKLDDSAWAEAAWTDTFVDIEGDLKPLPRFQTRAKMTWDDRHLYFAAELIEPHIWATLTEHDSVIFRDNDFEVFIDPDGDRHQYYEFEINALNTSWDLRLVKPYRDGGPALNNWEIPGLKTAIDIQGTLNDPSDLDDRWTVEIAMPWDVLAEFTEQPCPPRDGDTWRINFSRVEWRHLVVNGDYTKVPNVREDNWVWSPQGVIDMHRPETWGYVQFSKVPPGTVDFVRDPAWAAKMVLRNVYEAQRRFRQANERWAGSLEELDLTLPEVEGLGPVEITIDDDTYVISVPRTTDDSSIETWSIRSDGLLTSRP